MSRCRLDAVLIARDEARCIARAVSTMRPHVDRVIVLDTGSADNTVDLALRAGAEVHHLPWPGNFSVARNAALALSDAHWRVVIDADEWLMDGADALQSLRHLPPDFLGCIEICNVFQVAGLPQQQDRSHQCRLLPVGAHYQGRIHEQVAGDWPIQQLHVTLGHDGYLPEPMARKGDRNQVLLSQALREQPLDAYLHYQMGKDHEVHDRFAEAWPHYTCALDLLGPQAGRNPAWRHDLVVRTMYVAKACGQLAAGLELASNEQSLWPDSPDFFFTLGDLLLEGATQEPSSAAQWVPMIQAAWERCLIIGDNPALEGAVAGRGSHLAAHNLDLLQHCLQG